jgi:hypothetical protein
LWYVRQICSTIREKFILVEAKIQKIISNAY